MELLSNNRKWPALPILDLYAKGNSTGWNALLTTALSKHDLTGLAKLLYGLQAGMADLVKGKMATEELTTWFIRMQKSIENTARQIVREKYPNPMDHGVNAKGPDAHRKAVDAKRKRDNELEQFFRRSSF